MKETVTGLGLSVLYSEGVGDPLVRGISLPVDAVRVDLQEVMSADLAGRSASLPVTFGAELAD